MRILVVAGASGGHIFPALSFLGTLKEEYKDTEEVLVLPKKSLGNQIVPSRYRVCYISISTPKFKFDFKNFIAISQFFKGSLESLFLLLEFRPDIVVGFGGLVCVPLILWSWLFRIKILIHEQNVIPGRANRLLAKFADIVAISFEETKNYFKISPFKIAITGNPIRSELKKIDKNEALNFFGFNTPKFTILVMGGSLGSHSINMGFLEAISASPSKVKIQIIHLTGENDYDLLKHNYEGLDINFRLFGFLKDMQYAYNAADLVVSRAGATTIAEIINFSLPAIVIPYPFAYQHQISNARVLEKAQCAIIVKDEQLHTDILRKTIENFVENAEEIKKMRSNYNRIARLNASDLLIKKVTNFA